MKFTDLAVSFRELCEPRYLRLSDAAKALHIAMKAWAADHQSDGVVPDVALQLIPGGQNEAAAVELVECGLWSCSGGDFRIDWTGQILAAEAREITEKNRKNWNSLKRHQRGTHGSWCPKSCTKSTTDARQDNNGDAPQDNGSDTRGLSSASVPDLTGPDRTDPQGIGEGGSEKRRSGARLVGAAALAPPASDGTELFEPDQIDHLALVHALRAAYVDNEAPISAEQKTQLKQLLPSGSITSEEIVAVLQFALKFEGQRLRDINSGVGGAILGAAELLGATGFGARWAETAANVHAVRKPADVATRR